MKLEVTDETFTKFLNNFMKEAHGYEGHIDVNVTEKEETVKVREIYKPYTWMDEGKVYTFLQEKNYDWKRLRGSISKGGIKENPIVIKIVEETIKGTVVDENIIYTILNGRHRLQVARELWGDNYNIPIRVVGEFTTPNKILTLYEENKDIRFMIDELGFHIIGRSLSGTFSPNDNDTVRTTV